MTQFILQLNGEFILDLRSGSKDFAKPFKHTKWEVMDVLDSMDFEKDDTILVFAV